MLRHVAAQTVLDAAAAYWSYKAAVEQHRQLADAEARTRKLIKETKELIDKGEVPAANIIQLKAHLADKRSQTEDAEQKVIAARFQLGLAMGLNEAEIGKLGPPRDEFPRLTGEPSEETWQKALPAFIQESILRRDDHRSSLAKEESLMILAEAAKLNLKSKLDLDLQVGYSGVDDGPDVDVLLADFVQNVPGANFLIGLSYQWPLDNNAAKGELVQQRSALRRQILSRQDLGRRIGAQVTLALTEMRKNWQQLEAAREAVELYQRAVEVERKKNRLGESTLIDVMDMEDRLTAAWTQLVTTESQVADSLAQLRFQSGTILKYEGDISSVGLEELTRIPPLPSAR